MKNDDGFDGLLERAERSRDRWPPAGCLDAETLAAYAGGSLAPGERTAVEAHAADCDRCLAVLAAIARTAPPPVVATRGAWLSVRWLVPVAAAAAVVLAVAIQQRTPVSPTREIAPPAVVDAIKPAAPPVAPPAALEDKRQASAKAVEKRADATAQQEPRDELQQKREADRRKEDAAAPAAASPAAAAEPAPARPAAADQAARPQAVAESLSSRAQAFAAPKPILIASPDPSKQWRILGRTVERSTDAGRTWRAQTTGAAADLLAGASPSADVCWIVGRGGLVILTTDGEIWRRIDFPDLSADLVAVKAIDASAATVTTARGLTYRTSDAGRTWSLQENPAAPF